MPQNGAQLLRFEGEQVEWVPGVSDSCFEMKVSLAVQESPFQSKNGTSDECTFDAGLDIWWHTRTSLVASSVAITTLDHWGFGIRKLRMRQDFVFEIGHMEV